MDNLDAVLMRLAHAPLPTGLEEIDAKVLARIAARPAARVGMAAGAMTIAAALFMGVVGANVPAQDARETSTLFPLRADMALAPSTLLVGEP